MENLKVSLFVSQLTLEIVLIALPLRLIFFLWKHHIGNLIEEETNIRVFCITLKH